MDTHIDGTERITRAAFTTSNNNKTTFKRTRSLSNAVYFKHDNNVDACTVSALILLLVVKLSPEMNSATYDEKMLVI